MLSVLCMRTRDKPTGNSLKGRSDQSDRREWSGNSTLKINVNGAMTRDSGDGGANGASGAARMKHLKRLERRE